MPRFVFTTDVEKIYKQVLIAPENRQFQLIIWWKDSTMPISYNSTAAFLATKCLDQLCEENNIRHPLSSQFIKKNFYVDDGLDVSNSLPTAMQLQERLVQIMKKGGFVLSKCVRTIHNYSTIFHKTI